MQTQNNIEQGLLGAVLANPECLIDVVERVDETMFAHEANRSVYAAMLHLFNTNRPVDLVTVKEITPDLSDYCDKLFITVGVVGENAAAYAEMVVEAHKWRKLNEAADTIFTTAMAQEMTADEALDYAEGLIFEIADSGSQAQAVQLGDLLKPALDEFEAARAADGGIVGIPSGFKDVDRITSGWRKTDLTIVAARPAMGKSAFAMQVALESAKRGIPTVFYSLEMGGVQLAQRILTGESGVDGQRARTGYTNDDDWGRMTRVAGRLADIPLYIDDCFALSPTQLRARCRRMKMRHGLGMVVVDYLQLMSVPSLRRGASREQEIAQISRALKGLAKEIEIPVIALSQLSRAVETRGANARPQLSDLRESGAIEQDADNVLFLHRPEYYGITMDPDTGRSLVNVAEVIVAKQRSGPIGKAELFFDKASFSNMEKNHGTSYI